MQRNDRHLNRHHGAKGAKFASLSFSSRSSMCSKNLKCDMPAVAGVYGGYVCRSKRIERAKNRGGHSRDSPADHVACS